MWRLLPEGVTFRAKVTSWMNLFSFFVSLSHPPNPCSKQNHLRTDPGPQATSEETQEEPGAFCGSRSDGCKVAFCCCSKFHFPDC